MALSGTSPTTFSAPPVRVLNSCEWNADAQQEILAMNPEIMPSLPGPDNGCEDGCIFGNINATCLDDPKIC